MPIEKIIVSKELLNKIEKSGTPLIVVAIPAGTSPSATGDYVLQEIHHNYPFITVTGSTTSMITFAAEQAQQEKMQLKSVKLHVGISPSLDFEWGKEKK